MAQPTNEFSPWGNIVNVANIGPSGERYGIAHAGGTITTGTYLYDSTGTMVGIAQAGGTILTRAVPVTSGNTPLAVNGNTLSTVNYVMGTDGTIYAYKITDGKPRFSSMSYLYDIAEGNVAGHSAWSKTGYNPSIGTAEEDLWSAGGSYVFPTAAGQMEVLSSSTADVNGGTGVRTVRINYLDADYAEQSEIVTMGGTAIVATASTAIMRVNSFRVATCGTGNKAAGNITLRGVSAGTTYSYITLGFTRARNVQYTVPANKTLYVTSLSFSAAGSKDVRFFTRANYDNFSGVTQLSFFIPYSEVILNNSPYVKELEIPTKLPAKTDIKVSAIASDGGALCTCALRGWLE